MSNRNIPRGKFVPENDVLLMKKQIETFFI